MANPYLQVLRTPHALPMVLAAFIGRLPLSMVGLGCVLLVASETGSYGLGGAVAAAGAVTTALAGPVLGRLGRQPRPAPGAAPGPAVFVASGVAFLFAVKGDWPLVAVFARRRAAGACIPPVSSMIRVRWTHLLRGSRRLPTALAMESVVDEFVFIVGPVLVTFLSTTGHATSGVVTAFALATVGSLLFAAQSRTEPPPAPHEQPQRSVGDAHPRAAGAVRRRRRGRRDPRHAGDRAGRVRRRGGRQVAVRRAHRRAGGRLDGQRHRLGHRALADAAAAPAGRGARPADRAAASRCSSSRTSG